MNLNKPSGARLPLVDESGVPPAVRDALSAMPPQATVYRMLAHAETAFLPLLHTVGAIQGTLALDPRLRQLAILRTAGRDDCEYERVQHEVISTIEGVSDEQIAALASGRAVGKEFNETETLVLRFVDEVLDLVAVTEATFADVARRLTPREIVELLVVIGQYHAMAMLLKSTALEPQPPLDASEILQARARRAALDP
jgi:4-carboxymuconolactone decarboxylase